jgi:hypothetical protein
VILPSFISGFKQKADLPKKKQTCQKKAGKISALPGKQV